VNVFLQMAGLPLGEVVLAPRVVGSVCNWLDSSLGPDTLLALSP
jgi:hypothetical protein